MPLLEVENLTVEFRTDDGVLRAVDGVSFTLERGETLGIVGESGSGKSVCNLALLKLVPQPPGRIVSGRALLDGRDLLQMSPRQLCDIRGRRVAMIFQDPMTSLNPFLTVAEQMTEVTRRHFRLSSRAARHRAVEMLQRVGIPEPERRLDDYPHQFSGGMRQRVMIAMALSCQPDILIADEPTTALDVTIQAQILELMGQLQREEGTAIVLITHDLGVVASICHRVNVMYAGRFVEEAPAEELFRRPRHPYTLGLLRSMPRLDAERRERLTPIHGQPPNPMHMPPGCAFHPRCAYRVEACSTKVPPLLTVAEHHRHACLIDVYDPQAVARADAHASRLQATED
jgi:oligopeptide transport system ATP-binding protein